MVATRGFILFALIVAYYSQPHVIYLLGAITSLPLFFVAVYRLVETFKLYFKVLDDIDKVQQESIKDENKSYLKKSMPKV